MEALAECLDFYPADTLFVIDEDLCVIVSSAGTKGSRAATGVHHLCTAFQHLISLPAREVDGALRRTRTGPPNLQPTR